MKIQKGIFVCLLLSAVMLWSGWAFWKTQPPAPLSATFSPDGQYLVFSIQYQKKSHIYRIRKDETELVRLTISPWSDFGPVYSPDGTQIVFSRSLTSKYSDPTNLYIMNADGSNITRLTHESSCDIDPVFSPDGERIYFVRARAFEAYSFMVAPAWHKKDIFSIRPDGTDLKAVTNESFYKLSRPSISPDGKKILASLTIEKLMNALWIIPIENAQAMDLVKPDLSKYRIGENANSDKTALYQNLYDPLFSSDGRTIFFECSIQTMEHGYYEYDLYKTDLESKKVQRLTHLNRSATPTDISRDGKEVVFLFDPAWPKGGKPFEIWLMNSDGTNPHRVNVDLEKCLNCSNDIRS